MKLAIADTSGPEFLVASPTIQPAPTNGNSRGSVIIDGLVKDPETGISQVALFNGGTRLNAPASLSQQPDGSVRYALALDTRTLNDGEYSLTIQATNGIGLINNKEIKIQVNNSAPTVSITNPQNGALLGTASDLTIKATPADTTPDDVVVLTYSVDGGAFSDTTILPKTDGTHTLTVRATDNAGNTGSATSTFIYDGTAPIVQITSPTAGQKFTTTPISIGVVGQDSGTGVAKIEVYADDSKSRELIGISNGSSTVTWYPRNTDGKSDYKIIAIATDRAGNTNETEIGNVQVQTASTITPGSEPSITVPDANPRGATFSKDGRIYVRGPLDIKAAAITTAPSMAQAELQFDGQTRASNTTTPNKPTFNFDFDTLNEGLHDVGVRFIDSLGTVASTKTSLFVDKTGPVIVWNTPLNGSLSNKPVELSATASDNASGLLGTVTFTENGAAITGPVGEGQHTITAVAADNVGSASTRSITFTVDRTGPEVVPTSPTDNQEFSSAPITLSANASDNLSGVAFMEAKVGVQGQTLTTLGRQSGSTYSAVYTPPQAGLYEVEYTAWDTAGNISSIIKRTFRYSVTTPPIEKTPQPTFTVVGSGPYTGNMSVNVSGNIDSLGQIDRMILQITDKNGVVDNTSYTTTQAQATFSVDTTKLANGEATLEVLAYTKSGLRGVSNPFPKVQIKNTLNPVLAVAAPSNGATLVTPTVLVKVTLTKSGDTAYTLDSQTVVINLMDYRGQMIAQRPAVPCAPSADASTYTCTTTFDMASLPADTYTVRTIARVDVIGGAVNPVELTAESRFNTNTTSINPPAATISFPTAVTTANNLRVPARIDSGSGFFATVSDNTGIQYVEARIVGPYSEGSIETDGTRQCQASGSVIAGESEVNVLLLNVPGAGLTSYQTQDVFVPKLDIDGSTYVPDSKVGQRYDLRVTTADTEGNRNIQCVPVRVERNLSRPSYQSVASTSPVSPNPTPGELTFTSGTWTLNNAPANSRVVAIIFANGKQVGTEFVAKTTGSPVSVSQTFSDVGVYSVSWLIEDMSTSGNSIGVVTSQGGGFINVARNPK